MLWATSMRLRTTLVHVAVLALAGCGGTVASTSTGNPNPDGGNPNPEGGNPNGDAEAGVPGPGLPDACGGCNCGSPPVPSGNASPDVACAIAHDLRTATACNAFCSQLNGGGSAYVCTLPPDYVAAYDAAQGDAGGGDAGDGGADAGLVCPPWTGEVVVDCGYLCLGRRTAGMADPAQGDDATLGAVFAKRAYLEAVSVHAFARLERELAAHGAPRALRRRAARARRDETRHTVVTLRLARRFGAPRLRMPDAPSAMPPRSLFDVALENAVEGCVRETYGAVVGLVEARATRHREVRRDLEGIAADECRHAELAWAVAAWALPRLTPEERAAVRLAVRDAVQRLAHEGNGAIVGLLEAHVWGRDAGRMAA